MPVLLLAAGLKVANAGNLKLYKLAFRDLRAYLLDEVRLIAVSPNRILTVAVSLATATYTMVNLGSKIGVGYVATLVLLVVVAYLAIFFLGRRPDLEVIEQDKLRYHIRVPPQDADVDQVIRASRRVFGAEAINSADAKRSVQDDPYSQIIAKCGQNRAIGFCDYYAFRKRDFEKYLTGRISQVDLFADYYLHHPEARNADVLYISTIFRYDFVLSQSFHAQRETALLVWALAKVISEVQNFPSDGIDIYSYGSSGGGKALLRREGFEGTGYLDQSGEEFLVRRSVTKAEIDAVVEKYAMMGQQCRLEIDRDLAVQTAA